MVQVRYSKQAFKKLLRISVNDRAKLNKAIEQFVAGDHRALSIKRMIASPYTRIRVGSWRVIMLDDLVVKIGSRGDVYK